MFEDFLDHKCDIYHAVNVGNSPGYGLPSSDKYDYFGVKSATITVVQNNPTNDMDSRIKLTLPFGVDIRANDKIVSKETGYSYVAESPRHPRNHHTFVYIKRVDIGRAL